MTQTTSTKANRGLFVVILLGVIFFALLTLLLFTTGKRKPEAPPVSESL
jgi:hypothetical protein